MNVPTYVNRPQFFACKFVRLLANADVANTIGADGCWLLAVIVATEDAIGYRRPVTFFNSQLLSRLGLGSEDSLTRLRAKVVDAGWLSYTPGRKGVPGTYFVVIPEQHLSQVDGWAEERPGKLSAAIPSQECGDNRSEQTDSPAAVRVQPPGRESFPPQDCGDNRGESAGISADHSSLTLSPSPKSSAAVPPAGESRKPAGNKTTPSKVLREPLGKREATARTKPAPGPHPKAVAAWCEAWAAKYGKKYSFTGKDGAAVKWMLTELGGDVAKFLATVARYLASTDRFLADREHPLGLMLSQFNTHKPLDHPPANPVVPGQHGAVYDHLPPTMTPNAGG